MALVEITAFFDCFLENTALSGVLLVLASLMFGRKKFARRADNFLVGFVEDGAKDECVVGFDEFLNVVVCWQKCHLLRLTSIDIVS